MGKQKLKVERIFANDVMLDTQSFTHICEPKEMHIIEKGFYEEYNHSFVCIHCGNVLRICYIKLTVV